jgi:hypothetical protein
MRKTLSLCVLLLALAAPALAATGLPFIHDDPAKALAEARQRKLPLFVEVGAPW